MDYRLDEHVDPHLGVRQQGKKSAGELLNRGPIRRLAAGCSSRGKTRQEVVEDGWHAWGELAQANDGPDSFPGSPAELVATYIPLSVVGSCFARDPCSPGWDYIKRFFHYRVFTANVDLSTE